MRVAILGGGIAGLSCASMLDEHGFEVTVFEKNEQIGGLCRSKIVDGYVFDLHGGHVFNSKYEYVKQWVFSKLEKSQWQYSVRNTKILYNNTLVNYPFELSLAELPVEEAIDCLVDFVKPKGEEPDNFHDWLIWNFGESIAEKYMIPYNRKIWSYPLEQMSTGWIRGKIPLPSIREVVTAILTKDSKERKMPHSTFYYPLEGGIQTMIDAIAQDLMDIRSSTSVEAVEKIDDRWIINGRHEFNLVVSTISLKELAKAIEVPDKVKGAIEDLKFNSLTTTMCESEPNDLSWLYIPSSKCRNHRVVFQGNFSPKAAPEGKSSIVLETIGRIDPEVQINELYGSGRYEDIKVGKFLSTSFTKYAYPVFDLNYPKNIEIINSYFEEIGLLLLGRFAEWKYYNMDICMKRAFEITEKLESIVS